MAAKILRRTSSTFVESCDLSSVSALSTISACELNNGNKGHITSHEFNECEPGTVANNLTMRNSASSSCICDAMQMVDTDSDSDDDQGIDEKDDIGALFEEIREEYSRELSQSLPDYQKNVQRDVNINDIETAINEMHESDQNEVISCTNCFTRKRVENARCLKKGQHISLPGKYFAFNIGSKLLNLYNHHAIVKQVLKADDQNVELQLIHYAQVDKKMDICETSEVFNLAHDKIYVVEHFHPLYDADKIVERAEKMLPKNRQKSEKDSKIFSGYNLLTGNCEHFATWCVVGEKESFQVQGLYSTVSELLTRISGVGCKTARFIKRFLYNVADDISTGIKSLNIPVIGLGRKFKICKPCCNHVVTLWTNFTALTATTGIAYVLVHFLMQLLAPTPGIPRLIVIILLSLALQWGIGKVTKALMSPYACEKIPVVKLSDLNVGNIITFNYFGFQHFAIVTEVHEENEDSTIGKIRCVHYGLKSLNIFRKRNVIEEFIPIDLKRASKKLKMVDCRHLNSYPSNQVVQRVKQRLGETNWHAVSNRSDHLCFWAFVKNENELDNGNINTDDTVKIGKTKTKLKSSLCNGQTEVHVGDEVKLGDVVRYGGTNGIVVHLEDLSQCESQEFEMDMIVYQNFHARRVKKAVKIREKRLFVKNYHPAHCCSMSDRVRRACEKEKCDCWLEETFLENCILKETKY